ncbi:MAG: hypothetical protein MK214_16455 [Thalassotalea sp.]|nr:hypothetical protein [Thalassotalea sp.]
MSELQDMLRVQARLHRKQGANALGDLFENANGEIETLRTQLAKANEIISALSLETDNAITLQAERNQLKRDLAKANERVKELELPRKRNLELIKALFYAPSSPVTAKKAKEIEDWFIKFEQLRKEQE